jgi:hypothetical protein
MARRWARKFDLDVRIPDLAYQCRAYRLMRTPAATSRPQSTSGPDRMEESIHRQIERRKGVGVQATPDSGEGLQAALHEVHSFASGI